MISNIAVLFGGRSCEHEISILSAIQVMHALQDKYHVIPIYFDKEAQMFSHPSLGDVETFQNKAIKKMWRVMWSKEKAEVYIKPCVPWFKKQRIDFVFPVLHGLHGEDGSVQGMLEMLSIPYAGCDVLASATCMSKLRTKQLLAYFSIPTLDFYEVNDQYKQMKWLPAIIKPDRLGSSIGIQIVKEQKDWNAQVEKALLFDNHCLVEPLLENFDEINCSVKRVDGKIVLSNLELVNKSEDILSFEDKYKSKDVTKLKSNRIINPRLDATCEHQVYTLAYKVYDKLKLEGVIRIDFIRFNDTIYVNEVNTIPGSYAFYLWDDDFLSLLEQVMQESIHIYQRKECKIVSFDSDVLFHFHGAKK